MYAPWWQRVPGHHWGYFEIPPIPACLQTIACRVMFFSAILESLPDPICRSHCPMDPFIPGWPLNINLTRWTSALAESLQCKRHWTPPYQSPGPNLNLFLWKHNSWNHKMLNNTKRIERTFSEEGMLVRFLKTFHIQNYSVVTKVYSIHPLENKLSRISQRSITPQLC